MLNSTITPPEDLGDLDQEVTFEAATRGSDGLGGQPITGWSAIGGAWAKIAPLSATEEQRMAKVVTTTRYRVWIMTDAAQALALTTAHRMLWGGRVFNIREAPAVPPRVTFTGLVVETKTE